MLNGLISLFNYIGLVYGVQCHFQ